jgi:hypothetical protein
MVLALVRLNVRMEGLAYKANLVVVTLVGPGMVLLVFLSPVVLDIMFPVVHA